MQFLSPKNKLNLKIKPPKICTHKFNAINATTTTTKKKNQFGTRTINDDPIVQQTKNNLHN